MLCVLDICVQIFSTRTIAYAITYAIGVLPSAGVGGQFQ